VTDPKIPFQGIVETTNLIDPTDLSGFHVVHLLRYLHRSDPWFGRPDAEVIAACLDGLRTVLPDMPACDVVDRFVFRTPFVEPVYTTGYLARRPALEPVPGRIYLATTTQVYPQITSWNGSVGLARRLAERMLGGAAS
jgi:protoporphyrinogen oxidase